MKAFKMNVLIILFYKLVNNEKSWAADKPINKNKQAKRSRDFSLQVRSLF